MDWLVLVASGMMESVWAIALDKSEGFSHLVPSLVFIAGLALSMLGLGYATRTLPIGVAYAVWTGIGVVATAVYGMVTGTEPFSLIKAVLLLGLVGCIVGLRLVSQNA
ncbi:MAG: multidrug efflux SMR transporter [Coriobacteriales bacterium]|nr:multidrug efflux SMR transporter [Coriobacteriales bacterium]